LPVVVDVPRVLQVARPTLVVHALLVGEQAKAGMAGGAVVLDRLMGHGEGTVREAALAEEALVAQEEGRADPDDGQGGQAPGKPMLPAHQRVGVLVIVQGDARRPLVARSDWHGKAVPAARVPEERSTSSDRGAGGLTASDAAS